MLRQFSVTLETEILLTVTFNFLKQMIILRSFNSVLYLNKCSYYILYVLIGKQKVVYRI